MGTSECSQGVSAVTAHRINKSGSLALHCALSIPPAWRLSGLCPPSCHLYANKGLGRNLSYILIPELDSGIYRVLGQRMSVWVNE